MNKCYVGLCLGMILLLGGCAIRPPIVNQYQLTSFGHVERKTMKHHSILITQPNAMAGYDTEKMMYVNKSFQLSAFAHNSWVSAPANMLFPLITESLEKSHYFYAVVVGPEANVTEYRLDTELMTLQQNFIVKPSQLELVMQMTLTHVVDNRVVAAETARMRIPCQKDTPYGGVIAANQATRLLTRNITQFVINHIERDS